MVIPGGNKKRRDRPLDALSCFVHAEFQQKSQEIFLESKRTKAEGLNCL